MPAISTATSIFISQSIILLEWMIQILSLLDESLSTDVGHESSSLSPGACATQSSTDTNKTEEKICSSGTLVL